tara:strand:- start:5945 stop:6697 length:753 start_codon:yes stop_codon:yes gene_type:complete
MLKKRIIPTLLWKQAGLVKGEKFDSWRNVGSVMPSIKVYSKRDVDGLILLNIDQTSRDIDPNYNLIKDFCENCFVPFYYGGGITNIDQIYNLLKVGIDKIVINSFLYNDLSLLKDINSNFGRQFVVASIDYKKIGKKYICYSHNGKKNEKKEVINWIKEIEKIGVSEIILTSIDHDGLMKGYDYEFMKIYSKDINSNLIMSGGAGKPEDMCKAFQFKNVDAVAAASLFHFKEITPQDCKIHLKANNVNIR